MVQWFWFAEKRIRHESGAWWRQRVTAER